MEDQMSGSPVVNHVSPIQSESVRSFPPSQEHGKLNKVPQRGSVELTETLHRPLDHPEQQSFVEVPKHQEKVGAEIYQQTRKQQRVCCGIRLWLLISVASLALLIVIAALLGGILGTKSHGGSKAKASSYVPFCYSHTSFEPNKQASSTVPMSSPTTHTSSAASTNYQQSLPTPRQSSGIATLDPWTNDHVLLYYQLSNGSVVEVSFPVDDFNSTTRELSDYNCTLVTDIADHGSALTAVSWNESNSDVYHVSRVQIVPIDRIQPH